MATCPIPSTQESYHIDDLAQGCGNSSADALELPQSCPKSSVGNSHRSAGPRPTTLEEGRELFDDFSSISCLWFEIQSMRTYNFFDWVSNTAPLINILYHTHPLVPRWRAAWPAEISVYPRSVWGTGPGVQCLTSSAHWSISSAPPQSWSPRSVVGFCVPQHYGRDSGTGPDACPEGW